MVTIKSITNDTATINIDVDGTTYAWTVGGLSDVADPAAHLEANADAYRADIRTALEMGRELEVIVPLTLAEEIDAACVRLNAQRDAIQYGTFTDSHGHPYDVDSRGREKMTGLEAKIANGLTLPSGFSWTGADNEEYPHDTASFLAMTTEILIWTSTVHGFCVAGKGAVRAAETVEAVKAAEEAVVWP